MFSEAFSPGMQSQSQRQSPLSVDFRKGVDDGSLSACGFGRFAVRADHLQHDLFVSVDAWADGESGNGALSQTLSD
jgi:hypothetical protein